MNFIYDRIEGPRLAAKVIEDNLIKTPKCSYEKLLVYSGADFVKKCYSVILNADGDTEGIKNWVNALQNGYSKQEIIYQFYNIKKSINYVEIENEDYYKLWEKVGQTARSVRENAEDDIFSLKPIMELDEREFIEECYWFFLDREGETEGKNNWINSLRSGRPRESILCEFVDIKRNFDKFEYKEEKEYREISDLYQNIVKIIDEVYATKDVNGFYSLQKLLEIDNELFVDCCYRLILQVQGDEQGKLNWNNALREGMPREAIICEFADARRERDTFNWIEEIAFRQIREIYVINKNIKNIVDEYRNIDGIPSLDRLLTLEEPEFIACCYQIILHRNSDCDGLENWKNALNGGMIRERVICEFADIRRKEENFEWVEEKRYRKLVKSQERDKSIKELFHNVKVCIGNIVHIGGRVRRLALLSEQFREEASTDQKHIEQKIEDSNKNVLELVNQINNLKQSMNNIVGELGYIVNENKNIADSNIIMRQEIRNYKSILYNTNDEMNLIIKKVKELEDSTLVSLKEMESNTVVSLKEMESNINESISQKIELLDQKIDDIKKGVQEEYQTIDSNICTGNERLCNIETNIIDIEKNLMKSEEVNKVPGRYRTDGVIEYHIEDELINQKRGVIDDSYYVHFSDIFRGSIESIKAHLYEYYPFILEHYKKSGNKKVLDYGCGRGEFLTILKENNILAVGVDVNKTNAENLKNKDLACVCSDGNEYLEKIEDESLGCITSFQVAEHLTYEYFRKFVQLAYQKIAVGGGLIIETINPYCYKKIGNFAIDPTHIRLPSPDSIKFLLEWCRYKNVIIEYYAPIEAETKEYINPSLYEGFCIYAEK